MKRSRKESRTEESGNLQSLIQELLDKAELEQDFSKDVLREARKFKDNPEESDFANREDLRKLALCTIDGESAKDFDDAVYAEVVGDKTLVTVAIADVCHYVTEDSFLDEEAFKRGTSVYFPGNVVPMLPKNLSDGLCSLKPNVNRLCMAVQFRVGPRGGIDAVKLMNGVMKSQARLTYHELQQFLDNDASSTLDPIPSVINDNPRLQKSLRALLIASRSLRLARNIRGAIDFDVVESRVALGDDGEPIAIHPEERLEAHRVIEDLMVATNEVVARYFEKRKIPCVYRVHDAPDPERLMDLVTLAERVGAIEATHDLVGPPEPKALAQIVRGFQNSRAKPALNILLLRSMMQAHYSSENIGHYGLASKSYLHFTSPIRRYPDLVVHRMLKKALLHKTRRFEDDQDLMAKVAERCSDQERKATDLERQIASLHAVWFMRNKIGEQHFATVVGCTDFGLFVRLSTHHVEGLVHISGVGRGFVTFDPINMRLIDTATGQTFTIGDKIRVKVVSVNVAKRHIDFVAVHKESERSGRRR